MFPGLVYSGQICGTFCSLVTLATQGIVLPLHMIGCTTPSSQGRVHEKSVVLYRVFSHGHPPPKSPNKRVVVVSTFLYDLCRSLILPVSVPGRQ